MTEFLIVSNGYGEDQVGSNLAKALQTQSPDSKCVPFPLVGEGLDYRKAGLTPAGIAKAMPSGGFIRSFKDLLRDLNAGLLSHVYSQYSHIRGMAKTTDGIIAVGDVFALLMAGLRVRKPIFFIPTAKSNHFMPHSALELKLIRHIAALTFPRDLETAGHLSAAGIPIRYLGNPLMDILQETKKALPVPGDVPVLTLLPGSREEAYANARYMARLLPAIRETYPDLHVIVTVPPTLNLEKLKSEFDALPQTPMFTDEFVSAVAAATLCIGLAGTANEQAVEMGKPVLCFPGFGPQSTLQRFKEQHRLVQSDRHEVIEIRDAQRIVERVVALMEKYGHRHSHPICHSRSFCHSHPFCHSRGGGNPSVPSDCLKWIPASAGMTERAGMTEKAGVTEKIGVTEKTETTQKPSTPNIAAAILTALHR